MTATITILEELPRILTTFDMATAQVHRFTVAGRMQKRARTTGTANLVAAAKADKSETNRPFWDALFSRLSGQPPEVRVDVLTQARYHHAMAEVSSSRPIPLKNPAQVEALLAEEVGHLTPGQILTLSSRLVGYDAREWHIPMLDYRVKVSPENEELVLDHLTVLKQRGWLLNSGRSYHFIGHDLLSGPEGLMSFLGSALLFAPIVDGRWAAHQLIEGACSLRISSGDERQPAPHLLTAVPVVTSRHI
ncbi:primase 1D-like protein [Motilibacter rhizosphaerae]|uniref:primase 1D-like protein n=1 Tax=Motilibacter rhizosphaerae TaxID=598652 RepID=UPI00102BD556|nr:hypothetical protein [Motilibacter rhizosphaerae]